MLKVTIFCLVFSTTLLAAPPQSQTFSRPAVFEPNLGQAPASIQWSGRGSGYQLFLTADGISIALSESTATSTNAHWTSAASRESNVSTIRMTMAASRTPSSVTGLEPTGGISNYLLGNDPAKWHTRIPQYARLQVDGIYKGIDLAFHGSGSDLEYDFVVAPGADPAQIQLAFDGARTMRIDAKTGDLVLTTANGSQLRHARPTIYQERVAGHKIYVAGGYKIVDGKRAAFTMGDYDPRSTLIIDPTVTFTTFITGNAEDDVVGIAADASGNSYITGTTRSTDFPIVGGTGTHPTKPCNQIGDILLCAFQLYVTKLSPTGAIVFSTFIGGSSDDEPLAIAVDSSGIYVTGDTLSSDFATNSQFASTDPNADNAFVAKLSLAGDALVYCTTFGGNPVGSNNVNQGSGIALDSTHAVYVAGHTVSPGFPTSVTIGSAVPPMQPAFAGGFIDAFVAKLDANGALSYSTFLGGREVDSANGVAVDASGNAYVTGTTHSVNFPVFGAPSHGSPSGGDFSGSTAFVTKILPDGSGAAYSVFLGGTMTADSAAPGDQGNAIAIDSSGDSYITGEACSVDFPTTANAFQPTLPASKVCSVFATKLDSFGNLLFSTYLGGTNGFSVGTAISVNPLRQVYVAGFTSASDFAGAPLLVPNPYAGFVSKFSPTLGSLGFTTLLGDSVNGLVVTQPIRRIPIFNLFLPTTIYTAGVRFRPDTDVNNLSNLDGFVVKLNDPPVITLRQ